MSQLPSAIQRWLAYLERSGKSHHTIAAYRRALEHFIHWHQETYHTAAFDAAQLAPDDPHRWRTYQQTVEQASPATIRLRLVALRGFITWAVADGLIPETLADNIPDRPLPVLSRTRKPKSLNDKELQEFLQAVHAGGNERDIALIELLLGTGLRVSQLLKLRLGDIHIEKTAGHELVNHPGTWKQLKEVEAGHVTTWGGDQIGYYAIPLPRTARQAVLAYLQTYTDRLDDKPANEETPLWLGERGPLSSRTSIRRILVKYTQQAGLEPFGPHVLRHTFAIRYLKAHPHDLRGLAVILGHKTLKSVRRYL